MLRDHAPLPLTDFRGNYKTADTAHTAGDTVPGGFFVDSENIQFIKKGVRTRYGSRYQLQGAVVHRMAIYKKMNEAQRILWLDSTGHLWDSVTGVAILTIPAMTDFSMVTIFDRAYITPHNGQTGLPGEKVYVYTGTGVAAPAAGAGPAAASPITVSNSASSGYVEKGTHVFAVAFESSTGYISGLGGYASLEATGTNQAQLDNIPIGPPGTIARVIAATKIITTYGGDYMNQTYYSVPTGRILGNAITSVTLNFYDADLANEVTTLVEQLAEIPAGVGISVYKSTMIVWGEDANSAVIRVSSPGYPESFNSVEGFATINPGDAGGGIKNATEYRGQLIIFKSARTYSTSDNGNPAAFWEVGLIDHAIGCECHGLAKCMDFGETVEDHLFVASRSGFRLFVGTYSDDLILSTNIDLTWDTWAKQTNFFQLEVVVDPINFVIYIVAPETADDYNLMYICDYTEGVSPDAVKWTHWRYAAWTPYTVVVDREGEKPVMKFGCNQGIVKMDDTYLLDETLAFETFIQFPYFPYGDTEDAINHYTGIRARVRGAGLIHYKLRGLDNVLTAQPPSTSIADFPGRPIFRGFNFTGERMSLEINQTSPNDWFVMTKIIFYFSIVWEDRPVLQ